jgi:hypothetical protein
MTETRRVSGKGQRRRQGPSSAKRSVIPAPPDTGRRGAEDVAKGKAFDSHQAAHKRGAPLRAAAGAGLSGAILDVTYQYLTNPVAREETGPHV